MATGNGHAMAASVFGLGASLWLARAWRHSQDARANRGRDGKVVDLPPAAVRDPVARASPESESKQVAEHGKPLPKAFVDKIPEHEVLIIQFLLDYLTARNLPVDGVLVNGGYVRDLLLGKLPDDLDISMCLSNCEEEVTVEWILKDLALYVDELGPSTLEDRYKFASMKSVDILGDKSKNKQLDTAKAVFTRMPGSHPLTVEVDLMPTIGEEAYEDINNRIPTRDQRGTPKQDALRRDLTIGSMLVQVTLDGGTLRWVLLDYYGGLGDLRNGILRAPFPEELHQGVLCNEDKKLADVVGLDQSSSQQVWWVKILRDDPLRILRVFRFAAKLNFTICPSFWKVICFCLDNLKSKVAGSRKLTEILKLAKYGKDKLAHFIVLCFSKRFVYTLDGQETCLAPVMFGGLDGNSVAHFLPRVLDFDEEMFLSSMVHIPAETPEDELIGRSLVLALFCTTFIPQSEWKREDSSREEMSVTVDAMIRACNGLCVSNETRDAGLQLLRSYEKVKGILSYSISPVEQLFGGRTGATVDGLSGAQVFGQTHLVWEALDIKKAKIHYAHDVVVHLLRFYVSRECADRVECLLDLLRLSEAPKLTGRGVSTLKRVPPYLRSLLISHLMVLCRLNGVSYDLDAPGSLEAFLQEECKGLLHDLENEWYEAGSDQLKVAYAKTVNTPKKKNKPKASKVKKSPA